MKSLEGMRNSRDEESPTRSVTFPTGLVVNYDLQEASFKGKKIELSPLKKNLFFLLAGQPLQRISKDTIFKTLYEGRELPKDDDILKVMLSQIRRKMNLVQADFEQVPILGPGSERKLGGHFKSTRKFGAYFEPDPFTIVRPSD